MNGGVSAWTASPSQRCGFLGSYLLNRHRIERCRMCQKASSNSSKSAPVSSTRPKINKRRPVLLATALITVVSERGEHFRARALLDQGSEVSFITESLAETLELTRRFSAVPIIGIGAQRSNVARGATNFQLISRVDDSFACHVDALILPELTTCLPAARILRPEWPHLEGLHLADPDFATPSKVDVILGAHVYSQIIREGLRRGPIGAPIAQQTCLGWILSGTIDSDRLNKSARGFECSPHHESLKFGAQGAATTGGAKLQANLTNILVRWRYAHAFPTDIEETRHRNDLWISKFQLNNVTYPANTPYLKSNRNHTLQLAERSAMCSTVATDSTPVAQTLVQRYSGLANFLRVTAWCARVGNRFRRFLP